MPITNGSNGTGSILAFVDCETGSVTGGGSSERIPENMRREVVINGKKVKTVDVHAHCIVPEAATWLSIP